MNTGQTSGTVFIRGLFNAFDGVRFGEQILSEALVILNRLVIDPRALLAVDEVIDDPGRGHAIDRDVFQ